MVEDEKKAISSYEALKRAQRKYNASEKGKVAKQKYTSSEKGKKAASKAMSAYVQLSPKGKARNILSKMKYNSKKRGHEWSDAWWSAEQIEDILVNGKCAQSGLPFQLRANEDGQKYNRNPFALSPDRKDLTKGYEPSNVQWVLWIFNVMKNTFTDIDVETFLNAMKNKK